MIAGAVLIVFPEESMLFFWKDIVADYWLRTLGYFMLLEGLLSYKSSYYDITGFYRWIMNLRIVQPIFFGTLLIIDYANPGLMLYSTLELLLGLWTFFAFKAEND